MAARLHIQPYDAALCKIDIVPILCFLRFVVAGDYHLNISQRRKKQPECHLERCLQKQCVVQRAKLLCPDYLLNVWFFYS